MTFVHVGVPAETYLYGTQFIMISLAYLTLMPTIAFVFVPVFYNLELTSMYEVHMHTVVNIHACSTVY